MNRNHIRMFPMKHVTTLPLHATPKHVLFTLLIIGACLFLIALLSFGCTPLTKYLDPEWETKTLTMEEREALGITCVPLTHGVTEYDLQGEGEKGTVIFIHGMTLPMWVWDRQVEPFVAAGYRVLRFNLYGKGYSDRVTGVHTNDLFVEQLDGLLHALGIDGEVNLVGLSLGGGVVGRFTANYPNRVTRVAFIAPIVSGLRGGTKKILSSKAGAKILYDRLKEQYEGKLTETLTNLGIPEDPYVTRFRTQMVYKGYARSIHDLFEIEATSDQRPYYKQIEQDVLLIWGDADESVPRREIDWFLKAVPHAHLHVLPGIGHASPIEAHEEVTRMLITFFNGEALDEDA